MFKAEQKIWAVEGARGIAALLVVCVHASTFIADRKLYGVAPFDRFFGWGHAGVDFFFVLSGFIITFAHGRDVGCRNRLGRYAWRRISRIYFPYWAMMAILIPLYFISPSSTRYEQNTLVIVLSLFLLPQQNGPIYPPAWTLQFEVAFYTVFGILIASRIAGAAMAATLLLGTLVLQASAQLQIGYSVPWVVQFFFNIYNFQFFGGALVALFLRRRRLWRPRLTLLVGAAIFVGGGLLEVYTTDLANDDLRKVVYGSGAVFMLAGLVEGERSGLLTVPRSIVLLGTASYSIYIVHVIALMFLSKAIQLTALQRIVPRELLFCGFVVGAVVTGIAFSKYIERPLQRWSKAVSKRGAQSVHQVQ